MLPVRSLWRQHRSWGAGRPTRRRALELIGTLFPTQKQLGSSQKKFKGHHCKPKRFRSSKQLG